VAEYRQYGTNMTRDAALMLSAVVTVLRRQRPYLAAKRRYREAYKVGLRFWRELYGDPLVKQIEELLWREDRRRATKGLLVLWRYHPRGFASVLRTSLLCVIRKPHFRAWRLR
jgi:hypothetical protein